MIQTLSLNSRFSRANLPSLAVKPVKIRLMALVSKSRITPTMICTFRINRSFLTDIFTIQALFTVKQTSVPEHIHTFQIIALANFVLHHLPATVVTVQIIIIFSTVRPSMSTLTGYMHLSDSILPKK